ncbi:unnamed protein product [Lepeophtheirus salmonis]|uniref:(salmon louse) hypothetical protein n=1 Tax=Lepeophtheirus salmonis TaxID=72036 RepID=A0A7R8CI29_LEPSM|nr:unnamed protein product [Lepeophtheirus salmonis]CAF2791681.1 unnamed protein product [Lepeophtheirus salmonis]
MMTKEEPASSLEEDSTAGRLKFFKEGRCLLELSHRNGRNWLPITKKVYWPPSLPYSEVKREILPSCPPQQHEPHVKSSPCVSKAPRKCSHPQRCREGAYPGLFVMKPPPQVISLRKKVRSLKRKRRSPYSAILVGAFSHACGSPLWTQRLLEYPSSHGHPPSLKTVKSELFPISESTSSSSTGTKLPTKVKASTKKIHADTPRPSKTLPVTPTLARIKIEISGPSSPDRSHFTSPRKRALQQESLAETSPSHKRHRLSTDSLGSRDGSNSPYPNNNNNVSASPPRHHYNHHHNGRMSSFSIDSIISRDEKEARLIRPTALPASPSRLGDLRREFSIEHDGLSHGSRTPTPASFHGSPAPSRRPLSPPSTSHTSTPLVSITPYASRNVDHSHMDPRLGPQLAHLAGLAADPRLGLTPTGGPYSLVNPYSYLLPLMQGTAAGSSFPGTGRINWPPSSASVNASHRSSTSTAVAWPGQYRGEPKITSMEVGSSVTRRL